METNWRAVHLFVAEEAHLDTLALEAGSVLASSHDTRSLPWFFIRYTEGGPHLRLRVATADDAVWTAIREAMARSCEALGAGSARDGWAQSVTHPAPTGEIYDPGEHAQIAYDPEVQRYGGLDALAIHEELFTLSSDIALQVIGRTAHNSSDRMGAAMQLMLDTLAGMMGADADPRRYMTDYAASWRESWPGDIAPAQPMTFDLESSYSDRITLADERLPRTLSGQWIGALREARRRLDDIAAKGAMISPLDGAKVMGEAAGRSALASMTHSQIHMLNNRLGLWPNVEVAMAEALAQSAA